MNLHEDGKSMPQTRPDSSSTGLHQDEPQIHVSGIFIVILEMALIVENSLPIMVVISWLPSCARGVGDRLIAALSVTCILSALIPTPLGLASYFTGSWYGGSPTCSTYQVTSTWCNLSALALLTYMCVNCHFAVSRLLHFRIEAHVVNHSNPQNKHVQCESLNLAPNSNDDWPQRVSDSSICATTHTSDTHPVDLYDALKRSSNKSSPIQINPEDVTTTQKDLETNPAHSCSENDQILPGASVSSFESSKLEFITENMQSPNKDLYKDLAYDETKHESEVNNTSNEPHKVHLSNFSHNNKTENYESPSKTARLPCHSHKETILQNLTTTLQYDELQPSSSKLNSFSNGGHLYSDTDNSLIYENSTFLYTNSSSSQHVDSHDTSNNTDSSTHRRVIQNAHLPPEPRMLRARDYISIALFFLYSITLTISSLPVVGFGPKHDPMSKLCRSWLVPTPQTHRERVFFIAFLTCLYVCLLVGCTAAARVGYLVNKRVKQEMRRTTRLYHEEENTPNLRELSVMDDLKRHHSLSCLALCGILTWLPIAIMLTLQKSGVHISEATLVYSNIATSLPCLLNPLLYSLILSRYRDGYKAIIERCRRKKSLQKAHQLRNVHHACDYTTDTDVISSTDGHHCVHGRPNPTFDSCSIDEDVLDDDEDDDENIDDEDFDQYFRNTESTLNPLGGKLSEKTPLHTSNATAAKHGVPSDAKSGSGMLYHSKRHWPFPANSSQLDEDEKFLLPNEIIKQENETRL